MKILIIKPSSLGDVIHALRVVSVLRENLPGARIDWVIRKGLEPIIESSGIIDRVFLFERGGGLGKFLRLGKLLKAQGYDYVLDLQGLLRSALLVLMSGGKKKYGRADGRELSPFFYKGLGSPSRKLKAHAIERLIPFLKPFIGNQVGNGMKLTFDASKMSNTLETRISSTRNKVMLFPESRREEKVWPHFPALAKKITSSGIADVLVCGNNKSEPWPNVIDLRGQVDLGELPDLVGHATLVVSNDSAPLHLASAMQRPVIGLFGPTSEERYGPYPTKDRKSLSISSKGGKIEEIEVKTVFDQIRELLNLA